MCKNCAEEHRKLGNSISFLRSFNEKWDDYLLKYISASVNSRFCSLLSHIILIKWTLIQNTK